MPRLRSARCAVVGLGGVGSWVVEGLARTGFGGLTLVDFDDVCISNTNRQLHALMGTVGRPKVDVMAERVAQINPDCSVTAVNSWFEERTADEILDKQPLDVVVDAIDDVAEKCRLIDCCRRRGIPIVVSGGLGNRMDPTRFREADIARAHSDGLLKRVRKTLRTRYEGYPAGDPLSSKKWGVPCVFSDEILEPQLEESRDKMGVVRRTCDTTYGTFCPAAGALGFTLAHSATKLAIGS
mmetsp:Transcript_34848/g.80838  ORF Transcript_34848/g.80838 Transcript_34848/m.80838 type:complete len:239 (+) Transcript_34848:165-881(+)